MSNLDYPGFSSKFKLFSLRSFIPTSYSSPAGSLIWPPRISYSAWTTLLKRYLRSIAQKNKKKLSGCRKFFKAKTEQKIDMVHNQTKMIVDQLKACKTTDQKEMKLSLITMFKQFCDRKHIAEHIHETISDHRNQNLITYSKESIMLSALSIFLFRMGSGNKFNDKCHDYEEEYSQANIAKFIDAPEKKVPVIKTIEDFLTRLEENKMNQLMIAFFKDLQRSKFFIKHSQIMPGDFFLLAVDCVHTHTYDHPHHVDMNGNNDCEFCLKRIYHKKTEKEYVQWLHQTLVFSFVFMGGLKIPIFSYPIHAKQIVNLERVSEDNHKQECELIGLKTALPLIREAFPKIKIVLLLDGLYANKPIIRLAEDHRCGYIIVRKEGCLSLLGKECDEHAIEPNHKKNCTKKTQRSCEGWLIDHQYEWFNSRYLGEGISTNVLRFFETRAKEGRDTEYYKCEWLFSWKISIKNCGLSATQARARWEIEDLFNTLKCRGYRFNHDYSRNPHSCFNWHSVALFAFGIFELFRFSEPVKARGKFPQTTLAEKLLGQLIYKPTEEIFSENCLLKKIQFRYDFILDLVLFHQIGRDNHLTVLDTG